ncbi:hypothetical protein ABEB36_001101 [Hypothenemus hampei]|uniref:Uncharacterized protein n=1 Tax=Hypothenemus hampei TaxID=57062 RepID=A0ABD1FH10_HYPHA
MSSRNCSVTRKGTVAMLVDLHKHYLKLGLNYDELTDAALPVDQGSTTGKYNSLTVLTKIGFICSLIALIIDLGGLKLLLGIRCFVPHNYFTWEATRPLSDCSFCSNVTQAIELSNNITRNEFEPYAYSSMPIVIRGAFLHWPAMETFNYQYFKELYARMDPVYSSTESECQFLHFKSNFVALKDVFNMSKSRVENAKGEKSWYVGWENCYAEVQQELKKHFPIPHFLPEDAEIPNNAYVFMGYDEGASLHVSFS